MFDIDADRKTERSWLQ